MEFKNVLVKTDHTTDYNTNTTKNLLILEFPLPGGKAVYEIKITEDVRKNIEVAAKILG